MKTLISLANLAKTCGAYDIANGVFGAALSTLHEMHNEGTDISPLLNLETTLNGSNAWGVAIETSEYYGLICINSDGDELCLPIPLLTQKAKQFLLEVRDVEWYSRQKHNRRHFPLSDEKRNAAKRDIERRIVNMLPEWEKIKSNASEYVDF